MSGNQTLLDPPEPGSSQEKASSGRATERKTMAFSFDKSYWSAGPRDEPGYCSQQTLFDDLGKELLDHGCAGFNACSLACEFCSRVTHRLTRTRTQRWADRYVSSVLLSACMPTLEQDPENLTGVCKARPIFLINLLPNRTPSHPVFIPS